MAPEPAALLEGAPLTSTVDLRIDMALFPRVFAKLPVPREAKAHWYRAWLNATYTKEIDAARRAKNYDRVEELKRDHQFEIDMDDETEDQFLTKKLLAQARRLRVPVPHRRNEDGTESE